jgi:hypothetical protein
LLAPLKQAGLGSPSKLKKAGDAVLLGPAVGLKPQEVAALRQALAAQLPAAASAAAASAAAALDVSGLPHRDAAHQVWAALRGRKAAAAGGSAMALFAGIDRDGSKLIDAAEFGSFLRQHAGVVGASKELVQFVVRTADPNGDGALEYRELVTIMETTRGVVFLFLASFVRLI